ncbi:MAG TPA: trypsin-like peptidase domain-containing protein [Acidimicrobiales bacterium]|nr:trypsin-like peptidase domain-containing protein [Acidimicrobiales bacterium]
MEFIDSPADEPERGWVHPDDRLWRHPSELGRALGSASSPAPPASSKSPHAWVVAGLAGMIGALLTAGLIAAAGGFTTRELPVRSVERVATGAELSARLGNVDSVVAVAQKLRPSIVEVTVQTNGEKTSGSGVVFREDGHILTNAHVVENAHDVKVISAEGRTLAAKVIGTDVDTDIAVLKVDAQMPAATLGSVHGLQVGQQAIAIGSPLGLAGGPSVTVGVVSALGRPFDSADGPLLVDMIQTDAPISPGSSGGALVDGNGNVIGITTGIAVSQGVGAEGLGFATPIDIARDVAEQLMTTGKVVHIWLGVRGEDLDAAMAKMLGVTSGALVREVVADSPAARAGIKERDVITSVDGRPVTGIADVVISVRSRKAGDVVKVTIWRGTKQQTVPVTVDARHD